MKTKFLLLFLFTSICIAFIFPIKNVDAEGNIKEIDISTSPHKVFFEIINSKPGDVFTKTLIVQNEGTKDFSYLFSNRLLTGSEKIYKELVLTVTDKSGELYKGKLKDYEKLVSRNLKSNTHEELTFSIYFPSELGNDFQRLSCEFQFKFYVEGTLGGILPADGPKLPETGTNMFNILVAGAVLVLTGTIFQFIIKRRRRIERRV
ncbi:LPXTG-motif cell wall anchor domain-containing protein [Neobacillus bataviensis LMG 21833]|uniref:LPXTG-motif cell wall anchor domain-containing protein n=1 Tax=Neobacillus bataviensis LMG 21833 TaxID=1117379 RepID=K6DMW5_9BACI|nr:LPXTG cell wall anchor domain-containing protein [Neobacillus bataviensis]EKN69493.1 LPXTG-motif cell wall anchor domain-containing protein [Neobacillus bataviensis LMG 21833]